MIRLVAFDLDGTLTRGDTVIEALARSMGHLPRARALEAVHEARRDRDSLRMLREELARGYAGQTERELCRHLSGLTLAPGTAEAFRLLKASGVETAIVTFTWEFAAKWVAREVGADHWFGTRLAPDGTIEHVWEEDKGRWLTALMRARRIAPDETAAVGDSWRDAAMLEVAGRRYYVGQAVPPGLDVIHLPDARIDDLARLIVTDARPPTAPASRRTSAAVQPGGAGASGLTIVPFAAAHTSAIIDVIASVFAEYGMTFDLAGFDADLTHVETHYLAAGGVFLVLVDGPRVVGSVAALPQGGACEVKRLYLRPAYRGRGLGRRLLGEVLAWAADRGYAQALAWSDARLDTAHAVYLHCGFTRIGERVCDDIDKSVEYGFALDLRSPDA